MATIITKIGTPTNLSATTQAGGNLEASTTYYYRVVGWNMQYLTSGTIRRYAAHGDASAEGTFTTDGVNKSVHITWDNAPACTHYNVSITTVSDTYNTLGCGGYDGIVNEDIGDITDGAVGLTITDRSTSTAVFHSDMLTNQMSPHIDNKTGMIMVEMTGTETESLNTIYADVVAAGYGDSIYYDGYNFVMKGWITADTPNAGILVVENKRVIMLKGGFANMSVEGGYVFRFGRWLNDNVGGNPTLGSVVDVQSGRYGFYGYYDGAMLFYDSMLTFSKSRVTTVAENLYVAYYNAASGQFAYMNLRDYNSSIIGGTGRGTNSTIKDVKFGAGNNWSNNNFIRLKIWTTPNMPYSAGLGVFYDCDWNDRLFSIYTFVQPNLNFTHMFNCRYNASTSGNNKIENPDLRFYVANNYPYYSDNYIINHYSLDMQVLDVDGNVISGVTVSGVDGVGDPAVWKEAGAAPDYLDTGIEYTTDRSTDADGKIFYYVKAYKNYLNPLNTENIANYSYDTFVDNYYPYTFTFSKAGYRDYSIIIEELIEPTVGVITLEPIDPIIYYQQELVGTVVTNRISAEITTVEITGILIEDE